MPQERVLVAMSGGVDSSVAAALLHERGYDVIGVGLRLPEPPEAIEVGMTCCGLAGLQDARNVAAQIGIPFYTLDYRRVFRQEVMDPFGRAYAEGKTPNPCIYCNTRLKFGRLLDFGRALGAHYLATGHYARIEHREGAISRLRRGVDRRHDQSYFLYTLTVQQLDHLLFPLGGLTKKQVREFARERGLSVADKASSQDICFVGPGGYQAFLAQNQPHALRSGPIIDREGHELGRHEGIGAYTLGQRRGLGIAAEEPLYVIGIDAKRNAIIVGTKKATFIRKLVVAKVQWIDADMMKGGPHQLVGKTRYRGAETPANVYQDGKEAFVSFDRLHPIAAPGQAAVFYEDDVVVGGGEIDRSILASAMRGTGTIKGQQGDRQ